MTVHNWGENPKGVWTLNITDNILALTSRGINLNGYTQHDTSKQDPDVEDLEQEVCYYNEPYHSRNTFLGWLASQSLVGRTFTFPAGKIAKK